VIVKQEIVGAVFRNVYWSRRNGPPVDKAHVVGAAHVEAGLLRNKRLVCVGSPAASAPLIDVFDGHVCARASAANNNTNSTAAIRVCRATEWRQRAMISTNDLAV
jgi:hypothetical protein